MMCQIFEPYFLLLFNFNVLSFIFDDIFLLIYVNCYLIPISNKIVIIGDYNMCEILNRTVILPRFIVNQEDELKILPFFFI